MEKKPVVKTEEEIASAKAASEATLRQVYDKITVLTESTVGLYDVIEDYFFQDVDFQMIQGTVSPMDGRRGTLSRMLLGQTVIRQS